MLQAEGHQKENFLCRPKDRGQQSREQMLLAHVTQLTLLKMSPDLLEHFTTAERPGVRSMEDR